jgi:hypothetical protein
MTTAPEAFLALRPVCSHHPESVAVGTCERCGRYVCALCVSIGGRCRECLRQYPVMAPRSDVRAKRAARFLRLAGVAGAFGLLLYLWGVYYWTVHMPGATELPRAWEILMTLETILNVAMLALTLGTYILYLMWLHRVVRQIGIWGSDVGATPAWAIGCWFVPFVNLIKPFRVVRSVVRELGGKSLAASLHLGVWWGAFLLSRMLDRLAGSLSKPGMPFSFFLPAYFVKIASLGCTILAAFLCVRIVCEVQKRLDARRAGL